MIVMPMGYSRIIHIIQADSKLPGIGDKNVRVTRVEQNVFPVRTDKKGHTGFPQQIPVNYRIVVNQNCDLHESSLPFIYPFTKTP